MPLVEQPFFFFFIIIKKKNWVSTGGAVLLPKPTYDSHYLEKSEQRMGSFFIVRIGILPFDYNYTGFICVPFTFFLIEWLEHIVMSSNLIKQWFMHKAHIKAGILPNLLC